MSATDASTLPPSDIDPRQLEQALAAGELDHWPSEARKVVQALLRHHQAQLDRIRHQVVALQVAWATDADAEAHRRLKALRAEVR